MNEIIHKIKGYFGHGVPVNIAGDLFYKNPETLDECLEDLTLSSLNEYIETRDIKLKLRPLESLTQKEAQYISEELDLGAYNETDVIGYIKHTYDVESVAVIEYFHKHHIDYQDLIGQGLAVELNNKGE